MARKGQPKVRTGCLTCKTRKVKCDEGKPACARCTNTGRACDGYVVRVRPKANEEGSKASKQEKRNTPRLGVQSRPLRMILVAPKRYPGPENLPPTIRLNFGHSNYFDVFRFCIAPRYPDQDFWQRVVLRESMRDDCVRDSVNALGAIWQALCYEYKWRLEQIGKIKQGLIFSKDHQEALKYYARAVSSFRVRLARDQLAIAPRSIFICTYLFFVFEQIQGNYERADAMLINGLAILSKHLPVFQKRPGKESHCSTFIDDEGILYAESTLTRTAAINTTGILLHDRLATYGQELALRIATTPVPDLDTPLDDILSVWDTFVSRCGLWTFRTCPYLFSYDSEIYTTILETQQHVVAKYTMWRKLFHAKEKLETSEEAQKALEGVWPCLLMSEMCMACFFDQTELSWDDYNEECSEVLRKVEAVREVEKEEPPCETLNFIKCLYSLYVITQKCRDKSLRKRALNLLRQTTNHGVAWDIKAFIMSSEVHLAAEEEGRDESGFIPPSKRFTWTICKWNDNRTEMVLTLRGVMPDEAGEIPFREVRVRPEEFGLL